MERNFSERLNKLFSTDLSDRDMISLYIDRIEEFYDELKTKYNLPQKRVWLISSITLINRSDLPDSNKDAVSGIFDNLNGTYELVICPENTRTAYNEDKKYYNSIEDYIAVSAIHELAHAIALHLKECDFTLGHNDFWKSIYEPYKNKYSSKEVIIDKVADRADFCINGKRVRKNRRFIPRIPSFLIPGSPDFDISKYLLYHPEGIHTNKC